MCLTFVGLLPPQKGATAVQQECALKRLCFTMMSKKSERSRQNFRIALHFTPPLPLIISPREEFGCLLFRTHGRSDKSATVQIIGLAARIADERRKLWVTAHFSTPPTVRHVVIRSHGPRCNGS